MNSFDSIQSLHDQSLMPTYGRFPVALESGHGATATDVNGKEYIDFGSGIGVNALGYCPDGWVSAVTTQAGKLQHCSNLYYNPIQIETAAALCRATGMKRVFFGNSGAEANECAIKLARKYSFDTYGAGRATVIGMRNSFHGRTVTTLSATGQDVFHNYFFPFTEGFRFVEAGDATALEAAIDRTTCAVMLECIQGEGGVIALPPAYLQAVRALCDAHDLLLIIDEVQTGAGRTGRFLTCEHAAIQPDIVTMAKGLGGGLPIGACLCTDRLAGVMSAGTHGSTFGGNPIACAAAKYMIDTLSDEAFLASVREKGERLRARLCAMPHVQTVSGLGLMLGVALDTGNARDVVNACLEKGLLILTAKDRLRLLPPLNISDAELAQGLDILESVLKGL